MKHFVEAFLEISYVFIVVVSVCYICNSAMRGYDNMMLSFQAQSTIRRNYFYSEQSYELEPKGEQVLIKNKQYTVTPGKTYYMDKGNLKLYAEIKRENNRLSLIGNEYHVGGHLIDGTIKDTFKYDPETQQYVNKSQTIFISDLDDYQFTIKDKRTGICLPFNGTLTLVN